MGASLSSEPNSVPNPRSVCSAYLSQLKECKAHLPTGPLRLEQSYPIDASEVCEEQEFALKRCLAHAVDRQNATILYSSSSSRADKIEANRVLIKKLANLHPTS